METLPGELLVALLGFVDHLYGPCFVSKLWYKSCLDAKKHPMIAARCGDAFSLMSERDHQNENYLSRITDKLCKNGYIHLAYKISHGEFRCELAMLRSGRKEIILPLITLSIGIPILRHIGKLGPDSIAYNMLTERAKHEKFVLEGLCQGGHIEEFKRRFIITDDVHDNLAAYSFGSENIEFIKHMTAVYPIRNTGVYLDVMILLVMKRSNVDAFKHAMTIAAGLMSLEDLRQRITPRLKFIRHAAIFEAIEEHLKITLDDIWLYKAISFAPVDFLCWAWHKIKDISNAHSLMTKACLYGKLRFCDLINVPCTNCNGKYHKRC